MRINKIDIELTNICNLKCNFCSHEKITREKGFMPFALFKKIVDEANSWASLIDLDFYGEILLHPEFDRLIKYAKSKGLKTAVKSVVKQRSNRGSNSGQTGSRE